MVSSSAEKSFDARRHLRRGQVIPALPLALTPGRRWDERSQRAVLRYYLDAGVGGLAVGVHSTEFAIRRPDVGLYEPILALSAATARDWRRTPASPLILIAGLCGRTRQAVGEARIARGLGYHAGLLSLGAWAKDGEKEILRHCRAVAREIPLIGFYLQPAVGGRVLSYRFWRDFAEIPGLYAVKIAPFNRYQTLDVVRAVMEAGRDDVALYTGNDDNIIADLLTPFRFAGRTRFIDGGLLGQWGVWTERAVALFREIQAARAKPALAAAWLRRNVELTDANSAVFDPAHGFAGCIPGIHEVLRRQGLLAGTTCLDPHESLSPGQAREITRAARAYPWMVDDRFVASRLSAWRA
jgi:dihydrodipicolinate synthase/N-acetylneuraminate lyase